MRDCSMSCVSAPTTSPRRWSSRPRPRRCYRSSQVRLASCNLSSTRCWRMQLAFARLDLERCISMKEMRFVSSLCTMLLPHGLRVGCANVYFVRTPKPHLVVSLLRSRSCTWPTRTTRAYVERDPRAVASVELAGYRTVLGVPMLKEDELIGAMVIYRREVQPFTDKQIELVQNFAHQAVIAIENARLLNELRESLQQQTATAEVLRVISASPGELETVFQTMLANATRICDASFANLLSYDGNVFRRGALHNSSPAWVTAWQGDPAINRRSAPAYRLASTKQAIHIADMAVEYPDEPITRLAAARTLVIVPMLKENELIGAIGIYRQEVRPFTDRQIALV